MERHFCPGAPLGDVHTTLPFDPTALDASDGRIGALFPCNVVWEAEPGVQTVYHVSIMRIGRLAGIAPDDEAMADIVDEAGAMTEAAFEAL